MWMNLNIMRDIEDLTFSEFIYTKYPEQRNSETEMLVVAKRYIANDKGSNCLMATGFPFGVMESRK